MDDRNIVLRRVVMSSLYIVLCAFMFVILQAVLARPASAATPPVSCFDFDVASNAILRYYETEHDDPAGNPCPKNVDIPSHIGPDEVNVIGDDSSFMSGFYRMGLTAVTIPSTVHTIELQAFAFNNLTSIVIPGSVTAIGSAAFLCNNISEATIQGTPTLLFPFAFNGPDFSCDDLVSIPSPAAQVQYIQSHAMYVPIYMTNAAGYSNTAYYETDAFGSGDYDHSGVNEVMGGHLINPARTSVRGINNNGNEILTPTNRTGETLTDYTVASNMNGDFSLYYQVGQTLTINAPVVAGYITPAPITRTLQAGANNVEFRYATGDGVIDDGTVDSDGQEQDAPNAPDAGMIPQQMGVLFITGAVVVLGTMASLVVIRK